MGSYPAGASPYGALDMEGNVGEWVGDWYSNIYYSNDPTINPTGPSTGNSKVLRGGGFWSGAIGYLIANRNELYPDWFGDAEGIRCASLAP